MTLPQAPMGGSSPSFAAIKTPPFAHHSIAWSPFVEGLLATAAGRNFGLSGAGRLIVLQRAANGLAVHRYFDTPDCLYDIVWSEAHSSHIIGASGDGSISLFDLASSAPAPTRLWKEHQKEVFGLDWNVTYKQCFLSSSWDGSVKAWDCERHDSLRTVVLRDPSQPDLCVYSARISPQQPDLVACATSAGSALILDLRMPEAVPAVQRWTAHQPECLDVDWNKYEQSALATGGVDTAVRIWDRRKIPVGAAVSSTAPSACLATLPGHRFAVKRVRWSPHSRTALASASYDRTCRVHHLSDHFTPVKPGPIINHSEFIHACSWSLFEPNILATASWDTQVLLSHA